MSNRRKERRMRQRAEREALARNLPQEETEQTQPEPEPEIEELPDIGKVETAPKPKYKYGQVLPHELTALIPLIVDFYRAIDYKEAVENPDPLIQQMYQEMQSNPYSIVYACVDADMKPHGYMWFKVERNPWGTPFIVIEHDYIIPEHRHTLTEARMHHKFIEYVVDIAERCGTQYVNTVVTSRNLEKSRHKLGFKSVEVKMRFDGGATEFRQHNPSFQKFGKYEEGE